MITLARGETSVQLPDPKMPHAAEEPPRQRYTKSRGGVIRAYEFGDDDYVVKLSFRDVANSAFTDLKSFIQTTLQRHFLTCTYTDTFSTEHTDMRYMGGLETWKQVRGTRWQGELEFHKDLGA